MYAYNVPEHVLGQIARELGFELDSDTQSDRKRVRFTLKIKEGDKYRKLSPNMFPGESLLVYFGGTAPFDMWKWRRTSSVCFHGHYAFFERLFKRTPAAIVTTSRYGPVRYEASTFDDIAQELGDRALGTGSNIYSGMRVRDCCNCEEVKRNE